MKKLWGVSQGEYSDYRVVVVCASKQLANQIVEKMNKGDHYPSYRTEEFLLVENIDEV